MTFQVGVSVCLAYSVVYFVPLSPACYRAYFAASLVVPLFSAFGKELSCSAYHHHADCFSMLLCRNQLLYQTACSNDKPLQHCDRTKHGDIYLILPLQLFDIALAPPGCFFAPYRHPQD